MKKIIVTAIAVLAVFALALAFTACDDGNGGTTHTHSYSTAWSYDATQHWHECTTGDGEKTDVANHTGDPCNDCGYDSTATTVTFSSVTANGSSTATTTTLTLTFSAAIAGLTANDITLSGVAGVQKGALSGTGPTYTLPISGFTARGSLSVAAAKTGYNISGSPKPVTIYYYTSDGGSTGTEANPIALTEGIWMDGSLNQYGYTRWYSFNVTAGVQYNIRWNDSYGGGSGKTCNVLVSAYFGSETIFDRVDSGYNSPRSCTFNTSGTVKIKVVPYSTSQGTFAVMYTSDLPGPTNWTAVSDSTVWAITGSTYTSPIAAIAYGNNRFIAGGSDGKMAYSDDNGITWTAVTDSTIWQFANGNQTQTADITAIAYGNGRWVAGGGGRIAYSDDGESWTAVLKSIFDPIKAIAYGNNRWVAVGGGRIAYSDDGETWTTVANRGYSINAIAYGNNTWVTRGEYRGMDYSTDGVNWTAVSTNLYRDIYAIAYGNGKFVAVGEAGIMVYSADGETWTTVANSTFYGNPSNIAAIAYGNNRFVAGGNLGKMAYSDDGESWTAVLNSTVTGLSSIYAIAYGNNRFVAGGWSGKMAYANW